MEELIGGSEERVLIETYWNVNERRYISCYRIHVVLIETYWNVNIVTLTKAITELTVLIETYWNVND